MEFATVWETDVSSLHPKSAELPLGKAFVKGNGARGKNLAIVIGVLRAAFILEAMFGQRPGSRERRVVCEYLGRGG